NSAFITSQANSPTNLDQSFANGQITHETDDVVADVASISQLTVADSLIVDGVTYSIVSESGGYVDLTYNDGTTTQTALGNVSQYELDDGLGNTIFASFVSTQTYGPNGVSPGDTILGWDADNAEGEPWIYGSNEAMNLFSGPAGYDFGQNDFLAPSVAGPAPCFTPESLIETKDGLVKMSDLAPGDMVLTRDNGFQPLVWKYQRALTRSWFNANPQSKPVVVKQGAFGEGVPNRDLMVSPGHLMLASDPNLACNGSTEVLIPARQMVTNDKVIRHTPNNTAYIHLLFETHQVVRVDGMWSESFQPSMASMTMIDTDSRNEVLKIFPELGFAQGLQNYKAARHVAYNRAAKAVARGGKVPH
ncbi:MAG: Hint domain-containing protein, partial [Planktomarina sp.]